MIWNIIDRRKRPHRWKNIDAVIEAIEHDNSCADADQAPEFDVMLVIDHETLKGVSVAESILWADAQECPVTLYLYDAGPETRQTHFDAVGNRF